MNHWPYIAAAYVLTLGGMGGLSLFAWLQMRRAENQSGTLPRPFASSEVEKRVSTSLDTNGSGAAKQS
jgi:hypothetical protein